MGFNSGFKGLTTAAVATQQCIVQLHATVNDIKTLNVEQKNYGEFVSPVTFGPNLTKPEVTQRIFLEVSNIKFH